MMSNSIYDIALTKIDGSESTISDYQGKVMLIVNVASKCGLTPQYEGLEALYQAYQDKGLVVLGLPCNDFAGQEPGSNADIQAFCSTSYAVNFPLYSKVNINSSPRHPLYEWLINAQPTSKQLEGGQLMSRLAEKGLSPAVESDVSWNFEKFLVARDGSIKGRFAPDIKPDDASLINAIEEALSA